MKIYCGGRANGKTMKAIQLSVEKQMPIVCLNYEHKKDIEQMTYYIMNLDIDEDICKEVNCDTNSGELDCKDCIKQYFENKAKEMEITNENTKNNK